MCGAGRRGLEATGMNLGLFRFSQDPPFPRGRRQPSARRAPDGPGHGHGRGFSPGSHCRANTCSCRPGTAGNYRPRAPREGRGLRGHRTGPACTEEPAPLPGARRLAAPCSCGPAAPTPEQSPGRGGRGCVPGSHALQPPGQEL